MEAIQECVAKITSERGWSIQRLAAELELSYSQLLRLRSGERKHLPFDTVAQLFTMAAMSLDEALGIERGQPQSQEAREWRRRAERLEWMLDQLRGGRPVPAEAEADDDFDMASDEVAAGERHATIRAETREELDRAEEAFKAEQEREERKRRETDERTG